jgi:DNA polymerase-3 subunit epsilon
MFAGAQLSLDGADRLHHALVARGEPIGHAEAGRMLFALRSAPSSLVRRLVDEVVGADARFVWRSGTEVALAEWTAGASLLEARIERATFVVFDVETTGTSPARDRIIELGAVRIEALAPVATLSRLVDAGRPVPAAITALTGIRDADTRAGRRPARVVEEFVAFADGAVLVAHNARFDVGFVDAELRRMRGSRLAAPVVDTVALARRLLEGRVSRMNLATLAERYDTAVRPCHRALPDAQATAEVLLRLIGLAQERGVERVAELVAWSAPAERRVHARRRIAADVPGGPGVYIFRGRGDEPLYVGKAADLRTRVRSYFTGGRLRRAVEDAVAAAERVETRPLGSELEAALVELELIGRLRPAANVRSTGARRGVYLRVSLGEPVPRLSVVAAADHPGAAVFGPFRSRRAAERAAAAARSAFRLRTCRPRLPTDDGSCLAGVFGTCLAPCAGGERAEAYGGAVGAAVRWLAEGDDRPRRRLEERMERLAASMRYEEAAEVRDDLRLLGGVEGTLARLRRALRRTGVLLAPDVDDRFVQGFACCRGMVVGRRRIPRGGDGRLEIEPLVATLAAALAGPPPAGAALPPERVEAARIVSAAFGRPRPAVQAIALDGQSLASAAARIAVRRAAVPLRA